MRLTRMLLREILSPLNVSITEATTADEALGLIKKKLFNLIYMDIEMPGTDGIEATKIIRKTLNFSYVPIIIMTAKASDETIEQSFAAGASDYINKPLHEAEVLARTRAILEKSSVEKALVAAMQIAEKANNAKSQFMSSISHELRTPLNSIMGFSQLLASDPTQPLSAEQQENIDYVIKGGEYLLNLINEILDLAKIESGNTEFVLGSVALDDLLTHCVQMVMTQANDRKISIQQVKSGHTITADSKRSTQILLNLLSNAIKYNVEGGSILLGSDLMANGMIRITVTDSGLGISPDMQSELFEPFNRLGAEKTDTTGTGLGLVIVKSLVEAMGGQIGVDSELNQGSTFWVELEQASFHDGAGAIRS